MANKRKFGAIILAAGRGSRMKAKDTNKVAMMLANKPIILHAVHLLEKMRFHSIVVVVGFAKQSVMNVVTSPLVTFAEQRKRLGTGHAAATAIKKLPDEVTDVLVIQGDDSAFYKAPTITKLFETHVANNAALTFLTINVANPQGLGRIVRDANGKVDAVVEEKDATETQRKITEINPACYVFSVDFLKKYLPKIHKSPVTGEYYLTSLIHMALENNEKIETVQAGHMPWRGVNTKEELAEAERLFHETL